MTSSTRKTSNKKRAHECVVCSPHTCEEAWGQCRIKTLEHLGTPKFYQWCWRILENIWTYMKNSFSRILCSCNQLAGKGTDKMWSTTQWSETHGRNDTLTQEKSGVNLKSSCAEQKKSDTRDPIVSDSICMNDPGQKAHRWLPRVGGVFLEG